MDSDRDKVNDQADEWLNTIDDPNATRYEKFAAFKAFTSIVPTIGTCGLCGGDLKFEGRSDGLVVACVLIAGHRWRPSGELLTS